ncbi:MAG: transglycosylase domain-containing protein [Bacteroidia bacterium]
MKFPDSILTFFRKYKKTFRIALISIGAILFIGLCAAWALRNTLLQYVLEKTQKKIYSKYHAVLLVKQGQMHGFTGVELSELTLIPHNADTIVSIHSLQVSVRLLPLLRGDVQLDNLFIDGGYVQLVRRDSSTNIDAFLKKDKNAQKDSVTKQVNLAERAYQLIKKGLNQIPDDVDIKNFGARITDNEHTVKFILDTLNLSGHVFNGQFTVHSDAHVQHWIGKGNAYPDDMKGEISLYSADTQKVRMPYVDAKYHLFTGFDSLQLNLTDVDFSNKQLTVRGSAAVKNYQVAHRRIAKQDVIIPDALADFTFVLGENFVSVDSSSVIRLNELVVHPYVYYQRSPEVTYAMQLNSEKISAQKFMDALPQGMFETLNGIKVSGELSYHLNFFMRDSFPSDNVFDAELRKYNFQILQYGETNLAKLNGAFNYTPYEYGRPMRTFEVGPGNAHFTPFEQISPYLRYAVLCSEDPSFFYHRGFVMEAIRQSIATNYVHRKFKRGASTISMQLVKNIFLTRDKVLSRKFEEILITWLIENAHVCTKERMYEVYLNMIEWGPNVYGIGEASQFYFSKHPSQLTLQESIYLSSIIPRPKAFRYFFGGDGNLRPWLKNTYRFLSNRMLMREWIMPEDTVNLIPNVTLTGPAKNYIIITDTLAVDSLILPDDNGLLEEQE